MWCSTGTYNRVHTSQRAPARGPLSHKIPNTAIRQTSPPIMCLGGRQHSCPFPDSPQVAARIIAKASGYTISPHLCLYLPTPTRMFHVAWGPCNTSRTAFDKKSWPLKSINLDLDPSPNFRQVRVNGPVCTWQFNISLLWFSTTHYKRSAYSNVEINREKQGNTNTWVWLYKIFQRPLISSTTNHTQLKLTCRYFRICKFQNISTLIYRIPNFQFDQYKLQKKTPKIW